MLIMPAYPLSLNIHNAHFFITVLRALKYQEIFGAIEKKKDFNGKILKSLSISQTFFTHLLEQSSSFKLERRKEGHYNVAIIEGPLAHVCICCNCIDMRGKFNIHLKDKTIFKIY